MKEEKKGGGGKQPWKLPDLLRVITNISSCGVCGDWNRSEATLINSDRCRGATVALGGEREGGSGGQLSD